MGDVLRFKAFADRISKNFPNRSLRIADVAGGKGFLQMELRSLGYSNIVSWDKRKKFANPAKLFYKYGYFDYRSAPADYDLVVGMHPDQGTDHIIGYSNLHRIPFVVCPCCITPSAFPFHGGDWITHLTKLAKADTIRLNLKIQGKSEVLIGKYHDKGRIPKTGV